LRRKLEYEAMLAPEARTVIAEQGIQLVNYEWLARN
jgi:hypothetical protein